MDRQRGERTAERLRSERMAPGVAEPCRDHHERASIDPSDVDPPRCQPLDTAFNARCCGIPCDTRSRQSANQEDVLCLDVESYLFLWRLPGGGWRLGLWCWLSVRWPARPPPSAAAFSTAGTNRSRTSRTTAASPSCGSATPRLPGGYWAGGSPSWVHGYPLAEQNLLRIMREISLLDAARRRCERGHAG